MLPVKTLQFVQIFLLLNNTFASRLLRGTREDFNERESTDPILGRERLRREISHDLRARSIKIRRSFHFSEQIHRRMTFRFEPARSQVQNPSEIQRIAAPKSTWNVSKCPLIRTRHEFLIRADIELRRPFANDVRTELLQRTISAILATL